MFESTTSILLRCIVGVVTIALTFALHKPGKAVAAGVPHSAYHQTVAAPGMTPVRL